MALGTTSVTAADEAPPVWLDYTQAELDAVYDQAVYAPNLQQVLDRQAANSAAARDALGEPQRFSYGDREIEGLDVYGAATSGAPIHIYVHGGTWRFGQATNNAFAAELFVNAGVNFVVPDFSSIEEFGGDLRPLVDQLRRVVAWVHANAEAAFNGDPSRITLSGFSSGGHLAGVLLTTDWTEFGLPADVLKAGLIVSGMYDLTPVALSSRREYVTLTPATIAELSPLQHLDQLTAPLVVAHGTEETPEFQRQAQEFTAAVAATGHPMRLVVVPKCNHFETIETLGNPYGTLGRLALEFLIAR